MNPQTDPLNFETTAATFFILLLICLICIFLLVVVFLYKCFKTEEKPQTIPCTGEDCLAAINLPENQGREEFINVKQIMDLNMPRRPGILVQRRNQEEVVEDKENSDDNEDNHREKKGEVMCSVKFLKIRFISSRTSYIHEPIIYTIFPFLLQGDEKRPFKGVKFSKEVMVVELGKDTPLARSYNRSLKERK
ncbi:uncharacterized protein C2orf74 homolog [Suncus etruscus]|uniref:uncharacterized protein C2orf74 homolog n=1 Tax=Suncus etruscus TaxID=109475 RepID=UPI00210F7564|nr:uncharacterized protein C2orf74 homolog [Suncus etruscus]